LHESAVSKSSLMRNVPVFGFPVEPEDVVVPPLLVVLDVDVVVPPLLVAPVEPDEADDAEEEEVAPDDDDEAEFSDGPGVPTPSTGGDCCSSDDKPSAPEMALHAVTRSAQTHPAMSMDDKGEEPPTFSE
jgi:hypothetical protein